MSTTAYLLIATLHAMTPQGQKVSVPVQADFTTRPACIEHFDTLLQAARKQLKGPITVVLHTHCEAKERQP